MKTRIKIIPGILIAIVLLSLNLNAATKGKSHKTDWESAEVFLSNDDFGSALKIYQDMFKKDPIVITSYSIHYTKLYDFFSLFLSSCPRMF